MSSSLHENSRIQYKRDDLTHSQCIYAFRELGAESETAFVNAYLASCAAAAGSVTSWSLSEETPTEGMALDQLEMPESDAFFLPKDSMLKAIRLAALAAAAALTALALAALAAFAALAALVALAALRQSTHAGVRQPHSLGTQRGWHLCRGDEG